MLTTLLCGHKSKDKTYLGDTVHLDWLSEITRNKRKEQTELKKDLFLYEIKINTTLNLFFVEKH